MAEKDDVPVTLDMIATAGARRHSMGWVSSSNSGEKIVPHYLRASTGSCHDFCKYGRNHTFETKSRQPMPKNVTRRSLDGGSSVDCVVLLERKKTGGGGNLVDSRVIPERKKTATQMLKNVTRKSLDSGSSVDGMVLTERKKTSLPQMPENVTRKSLDGGTTVDSVVRLERKKTTSTRIPKIVARKSLDTGSSVDSVILPERKKTTLTRGKAEFSSTSRMSEANVPTFTRPKLSVESSGFPSPVQRKVLNERKKKSLAEPRTLPKSRSHTENSLKSLKLKTSSATRNPEDSVVQAVAKAKEGRLPEKSNRISKLKSIKVKPLSPAVSPANSRRKNYSKMGINSGISKVAANKVVATSTCSSSTNLTSRKRVNLKDLPFKTHNKLKISEHGQFQSEEVKKNTVRSEEVKEDTMQSEEVKEDTMQSEEVKENSVRSEEIKENTVQSEEIKENIVQSEEVKENIVRSEAVQEETFQSENQEVQEKTLYVIKIENEEMPHQSDQNETDDHMEPLPSLSPPKSPYISAEVEDQDVSEYTESEVEDDSYSESDEIASMETDNISSEGGKKGRSQNHGTLQEKDPQSTKVSFRRGKIIDIRSESNSPRRLKFRRGRLLGENQRAAADGVRKNFKRGKEVESDIATANETIVLRHQDVQGKKDAQGLFNNVIEETASKLVETRKSKVKALVGAFETVISLQDGKPSVGS